MSSVDLNIIERGLKGQSWTAEKGAITAGDLAKISEQRTNNSSALNALPTPFARFFVVKEAFRRALEELKNPSKYAGAAYNRLVSDTLDVFELLYNLTYHQGRWGDSIKLTIREWSYDTDLKNLKSQVPILGNAIDNYIKSDLAAAKNTFFFVVLENDGRDYLLATSSPYSGFVTPPDLDKKYDKSSNSHSIFIGERYKQMPTINRKSSTGGSYFRDVKLFGQRDKEFKNYMFNLVDNHTLGSELNELRDYIKQFDVSDVDINKNWQPQTKPILSDNSNNIVINGLPIMKDSSLSTVNFFSDTLIRVPFRLSNDFYSMTYAGDYNDRDFDFLLPIDKDALSLIDDKFECQCKVSNTKVTITLKFKGQEYTKEYSLSDSSDSRNRGRIVHLEKENISFNLAVFPNILSANAVENNYFKVMAVTHDATPEFRPFPIDNLELSFYHKEDDKLVEIEIIDNSNTFAQFGVRPAVVRSNQDAMKEVNAGSKFYEIFNTHFDVIAVSLALDSGKSDGVLMLKWQKASQTQDKYHYAIDLGTTNTYISSRKVGENLEPEQLKMKKPMVSFLHTYKPSAQHSFVSLIENVIAPNCRKNFSTEFVPTSIDGAVYNFPIRTALCVKKDAIHNLSLFDNCNIAFFYEKSKELGNQTILTDIKWESGENAKTSLRLFIRELLLIIKSDILQRNGLLAKTSITWFKPLSFIGNLSSDYESIWKDEVKNVLNIGESAIKCVSESEAPYYYFDTKSSFKSIDSVSIVDIGGGSSDFIYFADGKPQIANSIHFGCDILWSQGFSGFENDKDMNGIYKSLLDTIHFGSSDDELEQLNIKMKSDKSVSTKDIINFWLSNDKYCKISSQLKSCYKPLFLYHFASIVFFMAKMYKSKDLQCPRCVLFCGNGSRYIDGLLSSNSSIIKSIVTKIFEFVYGNNIKDIQIILPEIRKECTCFGGLYRDTDVEIPVEYNFQGVSNKEYVNVGELKNDFPSLSKELLKTLKEFNELYIQLLSDILIAKKEIEYQLNVNTLKEIISSGIEDSLKTNFKTQVVPITDAMEYHDSIFFLPIIDNILKLTHLEK